MSEKVRICTVRELPPEGEVREFSAAGRPLCVARFHGEVTAMENECPHNGGPLAEGMIDEGKVICPWHAWAFDRHTGQSDHDTRARVEVFPVHIEGDTVLAEI